MNILLVMNPKSDEYRKWGNALKEEFIERSTTVELMDSLDVANNRVKNHVQSHVDYVISGTFGSWDEFQFEPLIKVVNERNSQDAEKPVTQFILLTGYLTEKSWKKIAEERGWGQNFGVQIKNEYSTTEFMGRFGLPTEIQRLPQPFRK